MELAGRVFFPPDLCNYWFRLAGLLQKQFVRKKKSLAFMHILKSLLLNIIELFLFGITSEGFYISFIIDDAIMSNCETVVHCVCFFIQQTSSYVMKKKC